MFRLASTIKFQHIFKSFLIGTNLTSQKTKYCDDLKARKGKSRKEERHYVNVCYSLEFRQNTNIHVKPHSQSRMLL